MSSKREAVLHPRLGSGAASASATVAADAAGVLVAAVAVGLLDITSAVVAVVSLALSGLGAAGAVGKSARVDTLSVEAVAVLASVVLVADVSVWLLPVAGSSSAVVAVGALGRGVALVSVLDGSSDGLALVVLAVVGLAADILVAVLECLALGGADAPEAVAALTLSGSGAGLAVGQPWDLWDGRWVLAGLE